MKTFEFKIINSSNPERINVVINSTLIEIENLIDASEVVEF